MSSDGSPTLFDHCPSDLDKKRVRAFHRKLVRELTPDGGFGCLVTGDDRLRELNRQFLDHDYPTDVLSFPSGNAQGFLGEVAISVNRAEQQAAERGHSLEDEIEILLLHGALHLLGMDHERDRGQMKKAEAEWRQKLGLKEGLIARARKRR